MACHKPHRQERLLPGKELCDVFRAARWPAIAAILPVLRNPHEELTSLRRATAGWRVIQRSKLPKLAARPTGEVRMLKTTRTIRASRRLKADFDVEIAGVATAVPQHALAQVDASRRAMRLFPGLADYEGLFDNTGIETR